MTKPFEWPDVYNKWVTNSFEWFNVSNKRVTKSFERIDVSNYGNGWGSHSNGLFVVNRWPSCSNSWHKQLVNRKRKVISVYIYVFPSKVTNIKSLTMAVITRRFRCITLLQSLYEKTVCALHVYSSAPIYAILSFNKAKIDSPFGWTVPSWIIPHLSKESRRRIRFASYTFALILKLTLVKIICICACYLHKFTILRPEDIALVRPVFGKLF